MNFLNEGGIGMSYFLCVLDTYLISRMEGEGGVGMSYFLCIMDDTCICFLFLSSKGYALFSGTVSSPKKIDYFRRRFDHGGCSVHYSAIYEASHIFYEG